MSIYIYMYTVKGYTIYTTILQLHDKLYHLPRYYVLLLLFMVG